MTTKYFHAPVWDVSTEPVLYPGAIEAMEARVQAILAGAEPELVWLLEHPPVYTGGTGADDGDLIEKSRFPVYATGRGGKFTYHGPGQRVAYVMLDLNRRGRDLRRHVANLEDWVMRALADLGVVSERREGRVGLWVSGTGGEAKIAAIGVRVRRWVTFHGVSINVDPDLSHYAGIVPCGLGGFGVTSLKALGVHASMRDLDDALRRHFSPVFDRESD